MPTGGVPPVS